MLLDLMFDGLREKKVVVSSQMAGKSFQNDHHDKYHVSLIRATRPCLALSGFQCLSLLLDHEEKDESPTKSFINGVFFFFSLKVH